MNGSNGRKSAIFSKEDKNKSSPPKLFKLEFKEGIRKLLGHSDIKTTLLYIRSIPDFREWDKVRNMEFMQMDLGDILKMKHK